MDLSKLRAYAQMLMAGRGPMNPGEPPPSAPPVMIPQKPTDIDPTQPTPPTRPMPYPSPQMAANPQVPPRPIMTPDDGTPANPIYPPQSLANYRPSPEEVMHLMRLLHPEEYK